MTHTESDVFNLIISNYIVNKEEVLCAAYLNTPSKIPDNYLMINSFAKKDFSKFTAKDEKEFFKSEFSALNEKEGFIRFLNYSNKISSKIISKYNIRREKYKNEEWEGDLFFIARKDIQHKIGIELYYERRVNKIIENPFSSLPNTDFFVKDVQKELSRDEEYLWLHLTNKIILK